MRTINQLKIYSSNRAEQNFHQKGGYFREATSLKMNFKKKKMAFFGFQTKYLCLSIIYPFSLSKI